MIRSLALARATASLAAGALLTTSVLRADLGFTPLGDLPGGETNSLAHAISADGTTVVGLSASANGLSEAFRWTAATGMVALGDLPGSAFDSRAFAVSGDGSVVAGYGFAAPAGLPQGFRWTAAEGLVGLDDLPGGSLNSNARALSADGAIIVGSGTNSDNRVEALRWTAATGPTGLGFFSGGTSSTALGISSDGTVIVGQATGANGIATAFRHTAATGLQNLGALIANDQSVANAANADGSVVVGSSFVANFGREAFRWTAATGLVSLGDLPGGAVRSEALAVSADGSIIVGTAEGATLGDGAFIWDATNGLRSIRALLTTAGLAKDWRIAAATGISADGSKIVGYGTDKNGVQQAWLLDFNAPPPPPPPPATIALIWTESGPQPGPGLPGPSILRLGYDNGLVGPDLATHTGASGGGFNGVEYADGLILIANQGSGGTRTHDPRYSPILVSNLGGYDLDATPGFLWQATGGGNTLIKGNPSATLTGTGTHDRTYGTATTQLGRVSSPGFFTNALQVVGDLIYFSSTVTSPAGLHVFNPADGTTTPVHTAGAPTIYDFEIVGDQIYFGNIANNTLQRVNTDGTGLVTLVTGATFPNGIDVTDTHLYWSEFTTGLIRRANLDGTNPVTLIEDRTGLRGLAVLPLSLTTGPAPQALSITGLNPGSPAFRYTGAIHTPLPLTPTSTSGLPVTLEIVSGPATLSGNAITYTGPGVVVVRATQAGDANFAPASFVTRINAAPRVGQTITFPPLADLVYSGTPLVVTPAATASSGLTTNYFVTSGPATYSSATRTVTVNGAGAITVRATQTGDTTYAPAAFVERTFTAFAAGANPPFVNYLITAGVASGQRGPLDDPDADGIANLLEYALALAPLAADPSGLPVPVLDQDEVRLTYRALRADLLYVVETTTNLADPASWTTAGVDQGTPAPDGATTATVPVGAGPRFLRLRVTVRPAE
jgi:probable HAF family extracellular repeat protein